MLNLSSPATAHRLARMWVDKSDEKKAEMLNLLTRPWRKKVISFMEEIKESRNGDS